MLHETHGEDGRNRTSEKSTHLSDGRPHSFKPRIRSTTRHMAQAAAER